MDKDTRGFERNRYDKSTAEIREIMINDAIFYLAISSRNKQLLKSLENEILSIKSLLEKKCQNQED